LVPRLEVPVDVFIAAVQKAAPSIAKTHRPRTPPVTAVTNVVKITIVVVAVTARKT
tara:strand:+ start:1325 stop:1492 length:168 start_codon:yes stop_codon:yes gene_type:complete